SNLALSKLIPTHFLNKQKMACIDANCTSPPAKKSKIDILEKQRKQADQLTILDLPDEILLKIFLPFMCNIAFPFQVRRDLKLICQRFRRVICWAEKVAKITSCRFRFLSCGFQFNYVR